MTFLASPRVEQEIKASIVYRYCEDCKHTIIPTKDYNNSWNCPRCLSGNIVKK